MNTAPFKPFKTVPLDFVDLPILLPREGETVADADLPLLKDISHLERDAQSTRINLERKVKTAPTDENKIPPPSSRKSYQRPEVTWLRRTEYISSEFRKSKPQSGHIHSENVRALENSSELSVSKDALLDALESSFTEAQTDLSSISAVSGPSSVLTLFAPR